jgi:starch synthase (maltosyl-transferring)
MEKIKIALPRVGVIRPAIAYVYPEINAGKYPKKSIENQKIQVSADVLIVDHDIVSSRLLYKHQSGKLWSESRMFGQGKDRFGGEFITEKVGFYFFKIEAWVDHFVTWQHEVDEKIKARHKSRCSWLSLHGNYIV